MDGIQQIQKTLEMTESEEKILNFDYWRTMPVAFNTLTEL